MKGLFPRCRLLCDEYERPDKPKGYRCHPSPKHVPRVRQNLPAIFFFNSPGQRKSRSQTESLTSSDFARYVEQGPLSRKKQTLVSFPSDVFSLYSRSLLAAETSEAVKRESALALSLAAEGHAAAMKRYGVVTCSGASAGAGVAPAFALRHLRCTVKTSF